MVNHLRQMLLEAQNRPHPCLGIFQQGEDTFWLHEGRFYMKGPGIKKREITKAAYEFAKGESGSPSNSAVAAQLINAKSRLQNTPQGMTEGVFSKEVAERIKPHEADQAQIDALNSLTDTIEESGFGVVEPEKAIEPEPTPEPTNEPESNPIKQMFPGVKSMTIQFHEDSNPLRTALLEAHAKATRFTDRKDSNPLRAMLSGV